MPDPRLVGCGNMSDPRYLGLATCLTQIYLNNNNNNNNNMNKNNHTNNNNNNNNNNHVGLKMFRSGNMLDLSLLE